MKNTDTRKRIWNIAEIALIVALCGVTLMFDIKQITQGIVFTQHELRNRYLLKIIQQCAGGMAAILLMKRLDIRLFEKPQNLLYLIPCFIIAIDNFQFSSYFSGNMKLVHGEPWDFILFGAYCLSVGVFEECIFRGVIFSVLAGAFEKNKKGLWQTYIVSSFIFGVAHIFNGFSLGTLLQVAYTTLTGGLFAFAFMKTKNIFCAAGVHAVYNFGGLLFETAERFGLGNGVVFDLGTVITMLVVCVTVGSFVLYSVSKYTEEEQRELYGKLGVSMKEKEKKE